MPFGYTLTRSEYLDQLERNYKTPEEIHKHVVVSEAKIRAILLSRRTKSGHISRKTCKSVAEEIIKAVL